MKFVTIKESHYQNELVVLKSRLESEGIDWIRCSKRRNITAGNAELKSGIKI
jgi:hypothetical protein